MAEDDEHVSEVLNEKARYSCCKKKVNSATTCVIQQGSEIKITPQKEQDNKREEELTNDITKISASDSPIQQNKNDWVMVTKKKKIVALIQ